MFSCNVFPFILKPSDFSWDDAYSFLLNRLSGEVRVRLASKTYVAHLCRTIFHTHNSEGSNTRRRKLLARWVRFFVLSRSFYPSTSSTPIVRAEFAP